MLTEAKFRDPNPAEPALPSPAGASRSGALPREAI